MSSPPSPDSPPLTTAPCVPSQQTTSSHPIVPAGTLVTLDPTCLSLMSHQSLTPPLPYCCTPRNPGCPLPPRPVVPSPGCRVGPPGEPLQDTDARASVVFKVPWVMTLSLLVWEAPPPSLRFPRECTFHPWGLKWTPAWTRRLHKGVGMGLRHTGGHVPCLKRSQKSRILYVRSPDEQSPQIQILSRKREGQVKISEGRLRTTHSKASASKQRTQISFWNKNLHISLKRLKTSESSQCPKD